MERKTKDKWKYRNKCYMFKCSMRAALFIYSNTLHDARCSCTRYMSSTSRPDQKGEKYFPKRWWCVRFETRNGQTAPRRHKKWLNEVSESGAHHQWQWWTEKKISEDGKIDETLRGKLNLCCFFDCKIWMVKGRTGNWLTHFRRRQSFTFVLCNFRRWFFLPPDLLLERSNGERFFTHRIDNRISARVVVAN